MTAAENWISTKRASPLPGRSYLVASQQVSTVMDVAFFEGARPSGGLWWIMTNAEFPSTAITHFAWLLEPTCEARMEELPDLMCPWCGTVGGLSRFTRDDIEKVRGVTMRVAKVLRTCSSCGVEFENTRDEPDWRVEAYTRAKL